MRTLRHCLGCLTIAIIAVVFPSCSPDEEAPTTSGPAELWETVELPTSAEFHAIQFLDEDRGYVVGGASG